MAKVESKAKAPKPVEAFINWESKLREGVNYGTVKILSSDGMVWEVAVFRGKDEGPILGWGKPRRRQYLEALKKDYGKDLAGMSETWRTMIFNQNKGYELGSPLFLEQIKKMLQ